MKKRFWTIDIIGESTLVISYTLFICCAIIKEASGKHPKLLYNIAMILFIGSIIILAIYFVMCIIEIIKDCYYRIKNKKSKK